MRESECEGKKTRKTRPARRLVGSFRNQANLLSSDSNPELGSWKNQTEGNEKKEKK